MHVHICIFDAFHFHNVHSMKTHLLVMLYTGVPVYFTQSNVIFFIIKIEFQFIFYFYFEYNQGYRNLSSINTG